MTRLLTLAAAWLLLGLVVCGVTYNDRQVHARSRLENQRLREAPTTQEVQLCCLAYGGSSFSGPMRDALGMFVSLRAQP